MNIQDFKIAVEDDEDLAELLRRKGFRKIIILSKRKTINDSKRLLAGTDLVIGSDVKIAQAAREMGVPLVTSSSNIVTTVLPEGVLFEDLALPSDEPDVLVGVVIRAIQASETVKLVTGKGDPVFAPARVEVDLERYELRKTESLDALH